MDDNRYMLISKKKLIEFLSVGAVFITLLTGSFCYGFSAYYIQMNTNENVSTNLQNGGN